MYGFDYKLFPIIDPTLRILISLHWKLFVTDKKNLWWLISPFYRVYDSIKVQLLSCTWEATHTKVGKKQFACMVGKKSDPTKTRLPSFSKPQSVVLFFLSLFFIFYFLKKHFFSFIIFGVVHINSSFYLQNQSNFPFISGKCGNISNLLLSQ